jgi:hypothetical protein
MTKQQVMTMMQDAPRRSVIATNISQDDLGEILTLGSTYDAGHIAIVSVKQYPGVFFKVDTYDLARALHEQLLWALVKKQTRVWLVTMDKVKP